MITDIFMQKYYFDRKRSLHYYGLNNFDLGVFLFFFLNQMVLSKKNSKFN